MSDWKDHVRLATTANITPFPPTTLVAIDGVTTVATDRVLIKDQTTASQNGIYVVATSGSPWTRATDANQAGEIAPEMVVRVSEGTINANSEWRLTNAGTITIGTTPLTFALVRGVSDWKDHVRLATVGNISPFPPTMLVTIDGVTPAGNDRVLIKNQTDATQNGIYRVDTSAPWSRASDLRMNGDHCGSKVTVCEGTENGGTTWELATVGSIVFGTTAVIFAPRGPSVANIAALRNVTGDRVAVVSVRGYSTSGDGGEGDFYWDTTDSTSADNGGTIIQCTGVATGRWKRRDARGPLSVLAFGAKADAVQIAGSITGGTNTFTATTTPFVIGDVGKKIVIRAAKNRPLTGTFAITNGKRGVVGTGSRVRHEFWEGCRVYVGGVQFAVSKNLSGTYTVSAGSNSVTGISAVATNELYVGCEIQLNAQEKFLVSAISADTGAAAFTLDRNATIACTGVTARIVDHDNTHFLLSTNATSTASGLTLNGTRDPLIATIAGYTSTSVVTLSSTADVTASGINAWFGTDIQSALAAAVDAVGEVIIPPGDYLLATAWTPTTKGAKVRWMPEARVYTAAIIQTGADKQIFEGHLPTGFAYALDLTRSNLVWIGSTSPRAAPISISGPISINNCAVMNLSLANCEDDDTINGATGLFIGRLGPYTCAGVTVRNCSVWNFHCGIDVGGMQSSTIQDVVISRYPTSTQSTGIGMALAAYQDPDDTIPGHVTVIATSTFSDMFIFEYAVSLQVGGKLNDGGVQQCRISAGYLGGDWNAPWTLACMIGYASSVTIEEIWVVPGVEFNYAIQIGRPSASAGQAGMPTGLRIRNCTIGPITQTSLVAYCWQGLVIENNTLMSHFGQPLLLSFSNSGYLHTRGHWGRQSFATYSGAATADITDTTGFDYVDSIGWDGAASNAPRITTVVPLYPASINGTKTLADATSHTGTLTHASGATEAFASGSLMSFLGRWLSSIIWREDQVTPAIGQDAKTSGTVGNDFQFYAQDGFNGRGGHVQLYTGSGSGANSHGQYQFRYGHGSNVVVGWTAALNATGTLQTLDYSGTSFVEQNITPSASWQMTLSGGGTMSLSAANIAFRTANTVTTKGHWADAGLRIGDAGTPGEALSVAGNQEFATGAGKYINAITDLQLMVAATTRIKIDGTGIGFFAAAPVAKPTVTGSRGANAALASLLTALANLGLITDSSS